MRSLHGEDCRQPSGLTIDQMAARLARETKARQTAENILEEKSRELHALNEQLLETAHRCESNSIELNAILDYTVAGILVVQTDGTIAKANNAAINMFTAGADKTLVGKSISAFLPETDIDQEDGSEAEVHHAETLAFNQCGQRFVVEYDVTPIQQGRQKCSVWLIRNISRRKEAENKQRRLEENLNEARKFEALGTLASGVAHEINTPIQYVSDNVRFLKDSLADLLSLTELYRSFVGHVAETGKTSDLITRIECREEEVDLDFLLGDVTDAAEQSLQGLSQVATIVKAIKEFAHPGSEERSQVDLNELVENTLAVSKNRWKHVADLDVDLQDDLPSVEAYPGQISQALLNLVTNAADALETTRSGRGRIGITTRMHVTGVELRVTDNGCGMDEATRKRIFDPFFTTKDVGKGTGQGLAIVYKIITDHHKGRITCNSQEGCGSEFILQIPIHAGTNQRRVA